MPPEILKPQIDAHVTGLPIIRLAAEGRLTFEHLHRWLTAEYQCQNTEIAAMCTMGARFIGDDRAVGFVIEVARTVASGRAGLDHAARAVGLTHAEMETRLLPGVREYTGLMSWLALHGTPAEVAAVVHDDWVLYGAACAALARVVADHGIADGPIPPPVLDHLRGNSSPPQEIIDDATALVTTPTETGNDIPATRSLPLIEPALTAIWRAVAGI